MRCSRSSSPSSRRTCRRRSQRSNIQVEGLFSDEELIAAGQELEPNTSAALLVWENVWARNVAQSIRDSGGVLVAFERVPHDVVQAAREFALAESAT